MLIIIISISIIILASILIYFKQKLKTNRRNKIIQNPFPGSWEKILDENVQLYRIMPDDLKKQLHNDIKIFLDEKTFEGCGGLVITDEIRVTIACEACMLLLNRKNTDFPNLNSVLVYPRPYVGNSYSHVGGGQYALKPTAREGESWTGGDVVLAWDCVKHGAINGEDGQNVVLHEFAHQLDQEDGYADGVPIFQDKSRYRKWTEILGKEYILLRDSVEHNKKTLMDAYGATNPAEFFAVATETFFEKPSQMKRKEPELYEELKDYYKLDPVAWIK